MAGACGIEVADDYARIDQPNASPVDQSLLTFMVEQCDFDVEHADGSFLDHLYFCYEYRAALPTAVRSGDAATSILGTGNTFAMTADKIPAPNW